MPFVIWGNLANLPVVHDVIHMIASPRNISTALMYSFSRRKNFRVLDEPFYSYYLHKTGVPHPGFDEIVASLPQDADEVIRMIEAKGQKSDLFIKNMSHHIEDLELDFLLNHKIILLIRDPELQIASFSQVVDQPRLRDIGIRAQADIYDWLIQKDKQVILIDSGELLKDPESILTETCKRLEIPFTERMLSWNAGPISEDGIWAKYWYLSVHQSTGFQPLEKKDVHLEGPLETLYHKAKPYYDKLFQYALKANL